MFPRHVCPLRSPEGKTPCPLASGLFFHFIVSIQYAVSEVYSSAAQSSLLSTSDTITGITTVTKVVEITSFLDSSGTPSSSSTTSDPLDKREEITKVIRVQPPPYVTGSCQPLLCTVNVAVSDRVPSFKLEHVLNRRSVSLHFLLAPGVRKHGVSLHNFQSTISTASIRIDPVSLFPIHRQSMSKHHTDRARKRSFKHICHLLFIKRQQWLRHSKHDLRLHDDVLYPRRPIDR